MCFPHSERFAAKLVLFKTRKKFEIPLCYDFWKMFIEKRISQMSLLVSCKSSFIFKIIDSSNLIKSRWDEILFCFTLKNKGTTNASTIAIILQPCKLRYLLVTRILPLFSTAHKDEGWTIVFVKKSTEERQQKQAVTITSLLTVLSSTQLFWVKMCVLSPIFHPLSLLKNAFLFGKLRPPFRTVLSYNICNKKGLELWH